MGFLGSGVIRPGELLQDNEGSTAKIYPSERTKKNMTSKSRMTSKDDFQDDFQDDSKPNFTHGIIKFGARGAGIIKGTALIAANVYPFRNFFKQKHMTSKTRCSPRCLAR